MAADLRAPGNIPGPQGPEGPPGPDGPAGPTGGSLVYSQDVPASDWTIVHGLGMLPNVTIVDTLGREVEADIEYPDANTVVVHVAFPVTGAAYLS